MLDWQRFLTRHNIDFRAESRTDIAVHCPFCGGSDPSKHLSISLQGRGWSCWRNPSHRGKSAARLIQALLRCSYEQARDLAGYSSAPPVPDDEDFAQTMAGLLGVERDAAPTGLALPKEFHPLIEGGSLSRPFWSYLIEDRGYTEAQAEWIAENYELHYAVRGPYRYRLILPVRDARRQLMTWTGRSIQPDAELRYLTLQVNPEDGPRALTAPGNLLLGLPLLWSCPNPRVLVVTEGPLDAPRISALGHQHGVYGTCLFGLNLSDDQALLLDALAQRFERVGMMLDAETELIAQRHRWTRLNTFNCEVWRLPPGIKDPGSIPTARAKEVLGGLLAA